MKLGSNYGSLVFVTQCKKIPKLTYQAELEIIIERRHFVDNHTKNIVVKCSPISIIRNLEIRNIFKWENILFE